MRTVKHWALAVTAAAALALAGCGGGGSSSSQAPGPTPAEMQQEAVGNAVTMAEMAVDGLSATSTDMEVTAAETAIEAARTAIAGADLLSANQLIVLNNRLSAAVGDLATAQAAIADHRQMVADLQERMAAQRMAANNAIDAANTAVAGLSDTSSDADVQAAKDAIQAAKDAVMAATDLSMADRDALNARITPIETRLAGAESDITDHRVAMAAGDAVGAADTAVAGLSASSTDEEVQAAKDAIQAAKDALDAANARSAITAAEATAHSRRISMIESMLATTETAIAAYREQAEEDAETQRMADVAAARMMAMQSYMDADADATKAETAATEAEATSPGSPGAMAARDAATAARMAANAAKAAHEAIMDDMSKADADAQATMAANQAMYANSSYMTAKAENDTIQTAAATGEEQQRARDVTAATEAANDAAMAARASATAARTAATAARMAANAARDAYMHAMRARTDSMNAQMEYMEADTAATAAENAATAAEMAADDAEAAHMGIDAGGSADDAQMAQMTAESERDDAAGSAMTASTQQMTAETAQGDAEMASMTHVIALLIRANGQNIDEPVLDNSATPEVDEGMTVAELREAATERAVTALNTAAGAADNGEAGTTATAMWPADTADDPATEDADESEMGMLSIAVSPAGGTALSFETRASRDAMDLNDDGDTTDDGEAAIVNTVGNIVGLGGFSGFSISDGTSHAIVFTDKQQGTPAVTEVTAIVARELVDDPVSGNTVTDLGTRSGTGYTGVTYYEGTVADDTDPDTAFTGSLTCPSAGDCSAQVNADGTITVTGFVFTGSRAAREAVAAASAAENANYLAFGVWMREDSDGNNTADDPDFGAFAAGGAPVTADLVAVTGTATYEGSATGIYTAGDSVDYFQGDATLEADFGTDTEQGNITGMIDQIVAGGNAMDDVIYLNDNATPTDNIATDGTFSGDARMGTATTVDAVTTYTHNGSWSGQFFNAAMDDADTTDVNESVTTAPGSVAGTFGVTGTTGEGDDAVTRSYVGAFGAHTQ